MSVFAELEDRVCPVCGAPPNRATLFLEASYDPAQLGDFSFASRKTPEFMSYKLIRCSECSTVYAQSAPPASVLGAAYAASAYDSSEEAALAAETYMQAMSGVPARGAALEIGTGTGVLLGKLLQAGFERVVGVEPSTAAIAAAPAGIRPFIREGVFAEGDFEPGSFDLICCFMTLEHVSAPRELTQACFRLLAPGGTVAFVTHDYMARLNRWLGRRSPIIDIEHLQIFCPQSLRRLLADAGFSNIRTAPIVNRYPLRYWARLAPLPSPAKKLGLSAMERVGLGGVRLSVNVGNLMAFGSK